MSTKKPERWPVERWRASAETVGKMHRAGWSVRSYCRSCHLLMAVDLETIILRRGPDVSLWNRQARCRRIGCSGAVEFQGQPPGVFQHFRLFAEWPRS